MMYVLQLFYSSFIYFCLLLFLYVVSGSTLKEFIKRMKKKRRLFALLFCVCVCVRAAHAFSLIAPSAMTRARITVAVRAGNNQDLDLETFEKVTLRDSDSVKTHRDRHRETGGQMS